MSIEPYISVSTLIESAFLKSSLERSRAFCSSRTDHPWQDTSDQQKLSVPVANIDSLMISNKLMSGDNFFPALFYELKATFESVHRYTHTYMSYVLRSMLVYTAGLAALQYNYP